MNKRRITAFIAVIITAATMALSGEETFKYDPDAQVNRALNETIMFGYYVNFNLKYPLIYFRDSEKHAINLATYNYEKQFWMWKHKDFDSSKIDLKQFFTKIDLSKTTLDRTEPVSETVYRDTALENKPYDYSNDKDFSDFMKWCDKTKVPADTKNFYIMAANNAAKRGRLVLDSAVSVSDVDRGIQSENFKPASYKNKPLPYDTRKDIMKSAGGMQLYFEYRKRELFVMVDQAQNIFKDNKAVPVTIVELEPQEGNTSPEILRGKALVKKVQADLESTFHKKFKVKLVTMKISYTELANYGNLPLLTYFGQFMEKYVNAKAGKNTLIIYYMIDSKRLYAIDRLGTHPLATGPYGTDWERNKHNIMHEMGHTIGLRHHFNDTDGSGDIKSHISPACIMNYQFVSHDICPLCRYGMGLNN